MSCSPSEAGLSVSGNAAISQPSLSRWTTLSTRSAGQLGWRVIPRIARDSGGAKIALAALIADLHPLRAERSRVRLNPHALVFAFRRRFVRARHPAVASLADDVRHIAVGLDVETADSGLRDRDSGVRHPGDRCEESCDLVRDVDRVLVVER